MASVVTRAEAHAKDVLHAWTVRGLMSAAFTFKVFLAHVPDAGNGVTREQLAQVSAIAEKVIDHIDARIDKHHDAPETKLELATLVYRMRARLEEMERWGRHLPA